MKSEHHIQVRQERTFCSGVLSVTTTFRLLVTGDTDLKHLDRLIRILKLQQDILAEDEVAESSQDDGRKAAESPGPAEEPAPVPQGMEGPRSDLAESAKQ